MQREGFADAHVGMVFWSSAVEQVINDMVEVLDPIVKAEIAKYQAQSHTLSDSMMEPAVEDRHHTMPVKMVFEADLCIPHDAFTHCTTRDVHGYVAYFAVRLGMSRFKELRRGAGAFCVDVKIGVLHELNKRYPQVKTRTGVSRCAVHDCSITVDAWDIVWQY